MTRKFMKQALATLVATAAILIAVISVTPIGTHGFDGDEDDGVGVYSIVIEDELQ